MAKANKEGQNSKPRLKLRFSRVLLILLGANLILLFAPEVGMLNSAFYIGYMISWPAVVIGIVLLVIGFRGVYEKL